MDKLEVETYNWTQVPNAAYERIGVTIWVDGHEFEMRKDGRKLRSGWEDTPEDMLRWARNATPPPTPKFKGWAVLFPDGEWALYGDAQEPTKLAMRLTHGCKLYYNGQEVA